MRLSWVSAAVAGGVAAPLAVWSGIACTAMGAVGIASGLGPMGMVACATAGCAAGGCAGYVGARRSWWTRLVAFAPLIPLWTRFTRSDIAAQPARASVL